MNVVGSASLSSPFLRLWCLVFQPRILLFIDNSFRVYYLWCLLVACNVWFLISAGDLGCSSFFHPHTMWTLPQDDGNCISCFSLHSLQSIVLRNQRSSRWSLKNPQIFFGSFEKSVTIEKKIFIEKNLSFLVYIFPASPHPACNYCRGDGGVVFPFSFSNHLLLILEKQQNWCRVLEGRGRKDPSILI